MIDSGHHVVIVKYHGTNQLTRSRSRMYRLRRVARVPFALAGGASCRSRTTSLGRVSSDLSLCNGCNVRCRSTHRIIAKLVPQGLAPPSKASCRVWPHKIFVRRCGKATLCIFHLRRMGNVVKKTPERSPKLCLSTTCKNVSRKPKPKDTSRKTTSGLTGQELLRPSSMNQC